MDEGTAVWAGTNGTNYAYRIFRYDAAWNDVPGNYIFARRHPAGQWEALYIGETESLRNRLGPGHHRWAWALQNGMTHIHAHTSSEHYSNRRLEEDNLILNYQPVGNRS